MTKCEMSRARAAGNRHRGPLGVSPFNPTQSTESHPQYYKIPKTSTHPAYYFVRVVDRLLGTLYCSEEEAFSNECPGYRGLPARLTGAGLVPPEEVPPKILRKLLEVVKQVKEED